MADLDAGKADRQCPKCRHVFRDPSTLRRHLGRKRPCALVVDEDDGVEEKPGGGCRCRFCGRVYSSEWNVRRHLKSCPIAARGERGMDDLYAHVLEKTRRAREVEQAAAQEVESLRAQLEETRLQLAAGHPATESAAINIQGDNARVTNVTIQNYTNVTNININVFGQEDTGHITTASIRDILTQCVASQSQRGETIGGVAAAQAILQAALLIYSDPDRPGNITCYIPNKRDGNALVHGVQGWEIVPVPLVLPPMARASLDLLFDKQPFEAEEGDLKRCEAALQVLRRHEGELVASGAHLQTVLVRNKDLLSRVLSQLPIAGGRGNLKLEDSPDTDDEC